MDTSVMQRALDGLGQSLLLEIRNEVPVVDDASSEVAGSLAGKCLPLTPEVIEFKVGLFNTHTRLGHALQGAGTYALPGDTSRVRNPVRSAAARALTPGGGNGLGPRLRARQYFRCPPGYENGGRFAGRNLANCGRRLFEPPSVRAAADLANGPELPRGVRRALKPGKGVANVIQSVEGTGDPTQVTRNARIPVIGAANGTAHIKAVDNIVKTVRSTGKTHLVRRDGVVLGTSVGLDTLVRQKNNVDMDGGTLVVAAKKSSIGKAELPVLINTSLRNVTFTLPGAGDFTVTKTRSLSKAEKVAVSNAMRDGGAEALVAAVEASGGALKGTISGVPNGERSIRIVPASGGASRTVPLWVFVSFLKRGAPGVEGRDFWVLAKEN